MQWISRTPDPAKRDLRRMSEWHQNLVALSRVTTEIVTPRTANTTAI